LRDAIEFVVVDNNPAGRCAEPLAELAKWIDGYRYVPRGDVRGTAVRDAVFREASSPLVLCVDSHVLIAPGALAALLGY
ncbi:UNVERIFIED_CONTAM: glycosyltransferase, partial [Bacteroidetes bacterium 56_B9]